MAVPVRADDWRIPIRRRLRDFASLKVGWDSYNGKPIDARAIESATQLVSRLSPEIFRAPAVAPLPAGGIQLEWEVDDRSLEVFILPTGDLELLIESPELGEVEHGGVVSLPLPSDTLERLTAYVIWVHDLV